MAAPNANCLLRSLDIGVSRRQRSFAVVQAIMVALLATSVGCPREIADHHKWREPATVYASALAISPDSQLLVAGYYDRIPSVSVWALASGKEVSRFAAKTPWNIRFLAHPTKAYFVVCSA
jgi:hypothetical protein